jgi:predicted component of type VI protein secretion system
VFNRNLIAAAIALAFAGAAQAQDAELAKIREEIRQMKESYERRIETLEKRLAEAEATAGKPTGGAAHSIPPYL